MNHEASMKSCKAYAVDNFSRTSMDTSWPGWTLAQSGISASAGILGVVAGAWLTSRNQKSEQKHVRIVQQLQEFYSPMIGMRQELVAKEAVQKDINKTVEEIFKRAKEGGGIVGVPRRHYNEDELNSLRKLANYDLKQWENEMFPLYKKMLDLFTEKMWLAEDSTRACYNELTYYIEKWNRYDALLESVDVAVEITFHDDKKIQPFFNDIEHHFRRLQKLLE